MEIVGKRLQGNTVSIKGQHEVTHARLIFGHPEHLEHQGTLEPHEIVAWVTGAGIRVVN
jgi:hypothetical protein